MKIFLHSSGPSGPLHSKKFQKTLILAFEVIVQPPKTHFSTFSKVQKQKKVRPKSWKSHIVIRVSPRICFLCETFKKTNWWDKLFLQLQPKKCITFMYYITLTWERVEWQFRWFRVSVKKVGFRRRASLIKTCLLWN